MKGQPFDIYLVYLFLSTMDLAHDSLLVEDSLFLLLGSLLHLLLVVIVDHLPPYSVLKEMSIVFFYVLFVIRVLSLEVIIAADETPLSVLGEVR